MRFPVHIRPVARAMIFAALAVAGPAIESADAEDGQVIVGLNQVIRYRHLDFNQPQDRLALLLQVESAAEEYCDRPMVLSDREKCMRVTADKALGHTPEAVRKALALARVERGGVKQAKR